MFSILTKSLFAAAILNRLTLIAGLLTAFGVSAATLTVTDDNGEKQPIEIQTGDYVRFTAASDGDLFLTLKGFTVSIDSADGSSGSSDESSSSDDSSSGDDSSGGGDDSSSGDDDGASSDTEDSSNNNGSSSEDSAGSSDSEEDSSDSVANVDVPTEGYCAGFDPELADCDPATNFDPWIAGTGEVNYWIRSRLTEVFPFTLPERSDGTDAEKVWYGLLQMTTGERRRREGEDVFHAWFSETPNGPVIKGTNCEWYTLQARGNLYWTQDEVWADSMCFLGTESKILYVNFETRCYPDTYAGTCDDVNKRKSGRTYQFDVSRRFKLY